MAILEKIRKRTTVLILIIGLALFAFVISDVINKGGSTSIDSVVGVVNGEDINRQEFNQEVERTSQMYGPGASNAQVSNTVWENQVRGKILAQEFQKLGLNIESDQIIDVIKRNPSNMQDPRFLDDAGLFDENKFIAYINGLKKDNPAGYQNWLVQEAGIIRSAKEQMYFDLIKLGTNATLAEGKLEYLLNNEKVDFRYVRIPYTSIADSTIQISKEEIRAYVDAHQDEYKQDKARSIRYVFFEEKASLEDEKSIEDGIKALIEDKEEYGTTAAGFRNTTSMEDFLIANSDIKFDTTYVAKKALAARVADTLMQMQVGSVYGPYRDGDYFKVARMMGRRKNGSVKASHILIAYQGAQSANESITRSKEDAASRAKELLAEAKKDVEKFGDLAKENSDGPSASRGGDLGFFQQGQMVGPFNDFAFNNDTGTIGMVETDFGFHIVHIEDKEEIVQLAYMAREISPSEETVNTIFTNATKFEMETSEGADFEETAKTSSYDVRPVNGIKEMEENLAGIGAQRAIVRWAFENDTKTGDIKRFNLNNGYAVVQLTAKIKEGVKSAEDASTIVLPILRKKKKAAQIIAANRGNKDLNSLAAANNTGTSSTSAISMKSPTIGGAGREPFVIGTAFGLEEGQTSILLEGETGVFMIELTKKTPATELENYITYKNSLQTQQVNRVNYGAYNALKKKAKIEDNRASFY
ncbi:MAG: SurA N-terminal domain-containing protein [Flavobacteriaceae bacterium]|nr:SurA N-terminal domain-containing protein [Flavobacteriaceae bacterium]